MNFNKDFFNELRGINQSDLGAIFPDSVRPRVSELKAAGLVSRDFAATLETLVKQLYRKRKRLAFNADFISYPGHICTFPVGYAFKRQLNIGFYAGENPADDGIRIGLGFPINREFSQEGWNYYTDFLIKVVAFPEVFNSFFERVGGYAEPASLMEVSPMSLSIKQHTPDKESDWRFFGQYLSLEKHKEIICRMDLLVDEMTTVFDLIDKYRY